MHICLSLLVPVDLGTDSVLPPAPAGLGDDPAQLNLAEGETGSGQDQDR